MRAGLSQPAQGAGAGGSSGARRTRLPRAAQRPSRGAERRAQCARAAPRRGRRRRSACAPSRAARHDLQVRPALMRARGGTRLPGSLRHAAARLVAAGGDGPLEVRAERGALAQQARAHQVEQRVQLQEVVLDGGACRCRSRTSSHAFASLGHYVTSMRAAGRRQTHAPRQQAWVTQAHAHPR